MDRLIVAETMNALAAGVQLGAAVGLGLATVNILSRTVFGTGWISWSLQGIGTSVSPNGGV